jgi:hypothetical protein
MLVLLAAVARAEALRLQLRGIKQTFGCWNQPLVTTLPLSQNLSGRTWHQALGLQQMVAGISHTHDVNGCSRWLLESAIVMHDCSRWLLESGNYTQRE